MVFVGWVIRANANNGEIYVKPQNGFELEELHNVKIVSPIDNNVLAYDSATSLWTNQTATQAGIATTGDLAGKANLSGDSFTGLIIGKTNTGGNISGSNDTGSLSVRGVSGQAAAISFHRVGIYAINMGLDTDNVFRIGGWSNGNYLSFDPNGVLYSTGRNYSPHTPYAVAAGINNISAANARSGSTTVTLPAGRFTTTPVITVSCGPTASAPSLNATYHTASASSFVAVLYHVDASNWTGPYPMSWHAIQM